MKIFVSHFLYEEGSGVFHLDLEETTTIQELKSLIQSKLGINSLDQTLVKGHKPLRDGLTFYDYHIKEGDTIQLNLRLRGGGSRMTLAKYQKVSPVPLAIPTSSNKTSTVLNPNMKKNLTKISSTKEAVQHCKRTEVLLPDKFNSIEELESYFVRSDDERIRDWIPEIMEEFNSPLTSLHCDHLQSMLYVATESLELYHFELPTLEKVNRISLKEFGITSPIVSMAMPIDDSYCIAGTGNGDLVAYNIEKKELRILAHQVHPGKF